MNISIYPTGCLRSRGRNILTAIVVGSLISGLSISPAFADRGDEHRHSERDGHGDRGRHDDRGWHGDRGRHDGRWHDERGWHYYDGPYGYAQPIYAPPPVYVQPYQSPGINLILPIHIR